MPDRVFMIYEVIVWNLKKRIHSSMLPVLCYAVGQTQGELIRIKWGQSDRLPGHITHMRDDEQHKENKTAVRILGTARGVRLPCHCSQEWSWRTECWDVG